MNIQEAIRILRGHNAWRRYQGPIGAGPKATDPTLVGVAIDTAIEHLEHLCVPTGDPHGEQKFKEGDTLHYKDNPLDKIYIIRVDGDSYFVDDERIPYPINYPHDFIDQRFEKDETGH